MPSMDFHKKIGGRDFELYVGVSQAKVEYSLQIGMEHESVALWGESRHTELHTTWSHWAAFALRQIVASQKCELPRLQGYEMYLLNLWARELSTEVTVASE